MLYAICLAGVPGRIVNGVLGALRSRFTDAHVFRGKGAALNANGLAIYGESVVADLLEMASNAVFSKSARPHGFCRNTNRPCAIQNAGKNGCGRREDQSCSLKKPDFFVLFFQEGIYEQNLLSKLHHAAFTSKIPKTAYDRQDRTIEAITAGMKAAEPVLGKIRREILSSKSPLLLPPNNFGEKSLLSLFHDAQADNLRAPNKQFKRAYFRENKFAARSTTFQPAERGMRHGIPDVSNRPDIALSRVFRLGCQYEADLHFDVSHSDASDLAGRIQFSCREKEIRLRPRGRHVNVTVDDCVL